MDISLLVARQREHVSSKATLDVHRRIRLLRTLRETIIKQERQILDALYTDLRKSDFESYMTEVGIVRDEIGHLLRHLVSWSRTKRVKTPLAQFPARSFIVPEPFGVVLVMAPWNYPFQLCLNPLAGAIAAGNTVVLKPSAYAPATSRLLASLLHSVFDARDVVVVEGGRSENEQLLEQRFDHIFFTGSVRGGKLVMEKAARHLTPVCLELGGKSPVIVDATADIPLAAKRIVFGKLINAGQTCVAPDYVLAHASIEQPLFDAIKQEISRCFPEGSFETLPTIVNKRHFERLSALLEGEEISFGGDCDPVTHRISPTILRNVESTSAVMQEEIFGPILPILRYSTLDEAIRFVREREKPLALYLFTTDRDVQRRCISELSFGGGCVNDTIIHIATPHMGFGGVGESGMGSYHGKASFDTFTHYKSMVKKSNLIDLPFRYHPYDKKKERLVRFFLR